MKEASFEETEINFVSPYDSIQLSGTLSLPASGQSHPCAILVSGSGPQARDQNIVGHKIGRDIAHYLADRGIAVLRFDDRGAGKSEGNFDNAGLVDFRNDIVSACHFVQGLSQINSKQIGLVGHSVGGLLAPMTAVELHDQLAFIVSLAGPGMIGYELYCKQHELIAGKRGATQEEIEKSTHANRRMCDLVIQINDKRQLMQKLKALLLEESKSKGFILRWFDVIKLELYFFLYKKALATPTQPWFKDWLMLNPEAYWGKVQCPVLALNGGKDLQVPAENLEFIETFVRQGGNNHITTRLFPEMNHLFQKANTGLPEEYARLESGIAIEVLEFMADWIRKTTSAPETILE